jgi:hypothetical protein
MGAFFLLQRSAAIARVEARGGAETGGECRDGVAIRRQELTTYKIHYVNYRLGRNVDNGLGRHCPLLCKALQDVELCC